MPTDRDDNIEESPRALQSELLETIDENLQLDWTYFLQLITSAIIATLGLLLDNTAVVIGAMLISPLHWAMYAGAISIITSRRHLARKASINFSLSIALTLLLAALITAIFPLPSVTAEIQLRTEPTLLDLGIALTSSVIGAASLYFPRISKSITGVAIAIALMPALAVVGIGIQLQNWVVVQGSTLLFFTNVMAILFGGVVTLYLLKFRPRRKEEKQRFRIGIVSIVVTLAVISVPLGYYLFSSIQQSQLTQSVERTFRNTVTAQLPEAEIETIQTSLTAAEVEIESTVFLPESSTVTQQQREEILSALSGVTNREINLQLNLTPTLELRKSSDLAIEALQRSISQQVEETIGTDNITSLAITPAVDGEVLQIDVRLTQTEEAVMERDLYSELQAQLSESLDENFSLELHLVPITRYNAETQRQRSQSIVSQVIREQLPTARVSSVNLNRQNNPAQLEVSLELPAREFFGQREREELEAALGTELELETTPNVEWLVTRYELFGE